MIERKKMKKILRDPIFHDITLLVVAINALTYNLITLLLITYVHCN